MSDRFVLLGLGAARSAWFRDIGRLATSGALPVEFVKCVSDEELRARLGSGRAFSAAVIDASTGAVDRDLVDLAQQRGTAIMVVEDRATGRDWKALGVTEVLPADFGADHLLDVLERRTRSIRRGEIFAGPEAPPAPNDLARVIAITGAGGVGSSTAAMAAAQGLAAGRDPGRVLLADLTLHGELALLHGTPDVVPGLPELVEAHRNGRLTPAGVQSFVFEITDRRYHLLLGLRRHRDWAAMRPRAFEAAFTGLRLAYDVVVADTDPDVEGHDRTGSIEVEERNLMARTSMSRADIAGVVGLGSVKGLHAMVRTIGDLVDHGVRPERIMAIVNNAPRRPDQRASIQRALSELCRPFNGRDGHLGATVFLPFNRHLERAVRDAVRLPGPLPERLGKATEAMLGRVGRNPSGAGAGVPLTPLRPGTLGATG